MKLKQFIFAFTAMLLCFAVSVNAQVAKVGDTEYATLQAALDAAAAGTGNVTVAILADVNLTGVDWNPVTVSAPGYPVVTVEGNGKTITGLNDMLFAGTWAGKSGLIIKNLTIANSAIVNDKDDAAGNVGVGAFIGYPQASATITLENCHLKNSSVEGGHWTGGLIGMAGGYNGADGPVFMNLTIKGCSVTGSTITGKGSVGGVIGHGSCAAWTNVVIEETTVSDNTITSTGSSNVKAGAVMGTIGAAGQPTTVNGVTNTGGMSVSATVAANTVKSNGTEITTIYGRQGTPTGMLAVAGGSYDKYPIEEGVAYAAPAKGYKIEKNTNGTYGVVVDPAYGKVAKVGDACFETLAQAVAAVEDGGTITLINDEVFTANNYSDNGGYRDGIAYSGDKSFTIDLNGKTVSQDGYLNDYLFWFKNVGSKENTITIKNGTLDAGTTAFCALCTASAHENKLTVNTENVNLINDISNGSTVKIRAGSVYNAKTGTKITGKNSYLGIENWNAEVNIYDGAEIYMNGTSSYNGCLVGVGGNGTVNVYGGYGKGVSGGFIAMTSGGTINVEGGEWIANTDGTYANSNKSVLIAQSDKQYNAGAGNAVVNVTGGTFKGGYNCYGNKAGDAQINIKGGNFNAEPTSYVAEGYIAVENNGVWNVELAAAKIGTTAYATFEKAFEAVEAGETLTLLADLNLKEILTINKAITFDGNGKKLTSTAGRAINVSGADGVTIKNLTINASGERAINVIQNATNVTIENVTATAANYTVNVAASAPNAVVAIKNSTLNGLCTVNVAAAGANVTIDNSTVNCNDNNTTAGESYAALCLNKAAVGASIVATNTTVNVTEGSDSEKGRNGAENGTVTINGSTEGVTVTVAVITYPGSDNYHGFTSLADAIEFAKTGDVVTLIRDITASGIITINKAITLDGNGKTLTYTGNGTSARAIDVPAADGVKLEVTIKNLTVDCTSSYCQRGINYNEDGKLTLEGVTVKGTNVTYALNLPGSSDNCEVAINNSSLTGNIALNVWGEKSTINAENTTFTAVDNNTVEGYAAVKLNNDGTTSAEGTVINITGGKIDVTGSAAEDTEAVSNGTSTGKINISDSTVVNGKIATLVAVIRYTDGNSYSFMTIEDAIAKAQAGETVTLLRDITASNIITINKAITLDLNGKKVTSTAKKAFEVHADATIKNGAIEAVQRCVDTRKAVKLTLTGVELVAKSTTYGNPQPLTIGGSDNGTEVTMENVEINAGTAGYGIITFVETELTATNSTIGGYNALYVKPGSDNSVFNFVDSDLSGSTVGNDVEGNSFSVIAVRANNVTVNVDAASTVTAAGNYSYAISFKSKSDIDTPATGSSVTVAGTITGNILADLNGNTVKVKAEYADELAAAGYATIEAENGLVAAIKAVAKIGETYYATLAEAFAAAQDGETITVLQDIEVSETLVNTKKVTLDLNGKTISQEKECTASYEMINNKGNLTITGNGKLSFKDTSAGDPNFGWGSYTVRNEGTLVVEDGTTIEHKGAQTFATHMICAIFQYSGSTTINGGTISTPNYRSARLWKGDMTINGGTFDGQLWVQAVDNTAKLTINGGTFEPNGGDASAVFVTNNQYDVQFAVTDGTFNGKVGCSDATKLAGAITGGKFNEAAKNGTNAALLATGFIFGEATDGYYEVKDDPSTLYIANLDDLKAFRDAVNNGTNYYAGVNVYLAADIDMTGENWVGIGSMNAEHGFMGNFDGQGYKIKNLTITNPTLDSDGYAYAGLFGVTEGTDQNNQNTIKNLTIENVTITTTGHIAAAAVAYPYYTIIDNVKVCGDIKIQGGNYTAGVLAYTRRCVNASNLSIVGNEGSFVKGNQTVGGVISDIQMNGGLTAVYNNFSAEGLTISGEKSVGGISGIIATQTLDGATVKNVTLSCSDARVGIVSGCLGGTSTISNVTYENVTGATALIGASYKDAKAVAAKIGDTYYATLEDALAAESNEAVELLVPYVVAKGETVTLDLNGKTVTGTPSEAKAYAVITNYGTLTISNGSVICNHTLAGSTGYAVNTITNCGTLTIEDATIENKSTAQYQIGYAIDNNSTSADAVVNIKGGKVVASGSLYYDGIRQFCNSQTKENSVVVSGGEVSTIWMQNPSDGATKNTKDVKGSIAISGGKVGVLSLEPSANFEAAVTGGHFGEISYFQTAEGRDLKGFITGGTFDKLIDETFLAMGYQLTGDAAPYTVAYTGEVTELVLVDGEVTEFVNEKELTVGTLTYKRSNIKNTWTPFYVPFAVPVSALADKFDVAYINDVRRTDSDDDGELDKFSMEIIYIHGGNANGSAKTLKANYPYFIRSKSGVAEMEITLTNAKVYAKENVFDCTTMTEKFEIKGNYHQIFAEELDSKNDYVVGGGEWHHLETGKDYSLNPFRFYMTRSSRDGSDPTTMAPMKSMKIVVCGEEDENGATIIYDVVEDSLNNNGNDYIYDLQGRRVSEPKKGGIYIKNGKKILF